MTSLGEPNLPPKEGVIDSRSGALESFCRKLISLSRGIHFEKPKPRGLYDSPNVSKPIILTLVVGSQMGFRLIS